MSRSLPLALLLVAGLSTPCWAQDDDPIPALRERYGAVPVAVYELQITVGLAGTPPEVSHRRVVFVRDEGYRIEGPVEWVVHAEDKQWRCANHGTAGHFHMVEEQPWEDISDLPELAEDDLLLALLAGHRNPLRGESQDDLWTRDGLSYRAKGILGDDLEIVLDGQGALASYSSDLSGLRTTIGVAKYETPQRAPKKALTLGRPTPGEAWHELMSKYVRPRLAYALKVTLGDGSIFPPHRILGSYDAKLGFRQHEGGSQDDEFGSSLTVSDFETIWTSSGCANEPRPQPHACPIYECEYSDEDAADSQLEEDFLLAAVLGARGLEHWRWTRPWTQDGGRWLLHGEASGWVTEARFDERGQLLSLQRLEGDEVITNYELVELAAPRKLPKKAFKVDAKVHRAD